MTQMTAAQAARQTARHTDGKYAEMHRAEGHLTPTPDLGVRARALLEQAVAGDPKTSAELDAFEGYDGWEFGAEVQKVSQLLERAIEADPDLPEGRFPLEWSEQYDGWDGWHATAYFWDADGGMVKLSSLSDDFKGAIADTEATGREAAGSIAEGLFETYHGLIDQAKGLGLTIHHPNQRR